MQYDEVDPEVQERPVSRVKDSSTGEGAGIQGTSWLGAVAGEAGEVQ